MGMRLGLARLQPWTAPLIATRRKAGDRLLSPLRINRQFFILDRKVEKPSAFPRVAQCPRQAPDSRGPSPIMSWQHGLPHGLALSDSSELKATLDRSTIPRNAAGGPVFTRAASSLGFGVAARSRAHGGGRAHPGLALASRRAPSACWHAR